MTDDDMQHAPHCLQLVIVRTQGYSGTVHPCHELGALTPTRHRATPSTTTPKEK